MQLKYIITINEEPGASMTAEEHNEAIIADLSEALAADFDVVSIEPNQEITP